MHASLTLRPGWRKTELLGLRGPFRSLTKPTTIGFASVKTGDPKYLRINYGAGLETVIRITDGMSGLMVGEERVSIPIDCTLTPVIPCSRVLRRQYIIRLS